MMRARLFFLVLAILLVAGFAAQNWSEFMRTSPLTFGVVEEQAPLGLIMLGALGVALLAFLLSSAMQESRMWLESSRHAKSLQAQRDLAEKAEASRFTELRQHLDDHLRENRQRESIAATEFEKAMVQSQRELRNQLDLINRTLDARLGELEGRLESRLERLQPGRVVETSTAVETTPRERVKL
jgi:DNA anti-recombination protein RmuC